MSRRLVLPDVRSELAHHLSGWQLLSNNWVECHYTMSDGVHDDRWYGYWSYGTEPMQHVCGGLWRDDGYKW